MVKEVCVLCRYNTRPIELNNLQRIIKLVEPKVNLKTIKKTIRFTWCNNNKCQYGLQCSKTRQYDRIFRQTTNQLNNCLSAYIEQTEGEDLYQILQLLRGHQPTVYRQLEQAIKCKK